MQRHGGLLSEGATRIEKCLDALQDRIDTLAAKCDEVDKLKTSFKDLSLGFNKLSSTVQNQEQTFSNIQASIKGLEELLKGPGDVSLTTLRDEVSAIKRACESYGDRFDEARAVNRAFEKQLSDLQAASDRQQPVMAVLGGLLNGGQMTQSATQLTTNTTNPSASQSLLPAARASRQNGVQLQSEISSFTFRDTSPQTAYTHQQPSPVMQATEDDDEDDYDDTFAGLKRTASERDSAKGDTSRNGSLKRRRAKSDLKTGQPQQGIGIDYDVSTGEPLLLSDMLDDGPGTPTSAQPLREAPSSEMRSSWFPHAGTPRSLRAEEDPLRNWDPRKSKANSTMPEPAPVPQQTDSSSEIVVTHKTRLREETSETPVAQSRSGRPLTQKKGFAGQQFFPGKVPNYSKGGK